MESTHSQRWLMASFFTAVGLLFVYFIVSVAMKNTDQAYSERLASARMGPGSYLQNEKIHLVKDLPVTVQGIEMTYRGRSSGALLIDLVLLDLDRDYVYSRKIPIEEARRGFRISNRLFTVTSIDAGKLKLETGASKR